MLCYVYRQTVKEHRLVKVFLGKGEHRSTLKLAVLHYFVFMVLVKEGEICRQRDSSQSGEVSALKEKPKINHREYITE